VLRLWLCVRGAKHCAAGHHLEGCFYNVSSHAVRWPSTVVWLMPWHTWAMPLAMALHRVCPMPARARRACVMNIAVCISQYARECAIVYDYCMSRLIVREHSWIMDQEN